jgi:hypothetical protein
MLTRVFLLSSALVLLSLASASNAEARRLRLPIGASRATSVPAPATPGQVRTGSLGGASFSGTARPGRAATSLPIVVPIPRASEDKRLWDEAAAATTLASQSPVTDKPRRRTAGFEVLSIEGASSQGFGTLSSP